MTNTATSTAEVAERRKRLASIAPGLTARKRDIEISPVVHRLPKRTRAQAPVLLEKTTWEH